MQLTEHMIIARAKQSDLNNIKRINLWGCELTDISVIKKLANVEVLALSVNNLSCLKPLESCRKLQELYLRKNNIQDFNELLHLRDLPSLSHIWLAENPCCATAGANYRAWVVKMLPNLRKLDEEVITSQDIESARNLNATEIDPTPRQHFAQAATPIEPELPIENATTTTTTTTTWSPKADKQMQNVQLMQNQYPQSGSSTMQQNKDLHSPLPGLLEESFRGKKSPSPQQQQLYSINNSYTFESIEGTPVERVSPPSLQTSRSDGQKYDGSEAKVLRKANSLNQIAQYPQLNVVLQIQQPQTPRPHPPIPISNQSKHNSHRCSLQSINERFEEQEIQYNERRHQRNSIGSLSNRDGRQSFSSEYSFSRDSLEVSDRASNRRSASFNNPTQHTQSLSDRNESRRSNYDRDFYQEDDQDDLYTTINSARSSDTLTTAPVFSEKRRSNVNLLSALLCIVQELDLDSLQVIDHRLQCRMDELSQE